jgi:hypothetical protein
MDRAGGRQIIFLRDSLQLLAQISFSMLSERAGGLARRNNRPHEGDRINFVMDVSEMHDGANRCATFLAVVTASIDAGEKSIGTTMF